MEEMNNTNEVMNEETFDLVPGNNEQVEEGNGSIVPIIIGGLLVSGVAAGVGLGWKKLKGKREERLIRKLEKAGYIVSMPEEEYEKEDLENDVVEEDSKTKK